MGVDDVINKVIFSLEKTGTGVREELSFFSTEELASTLIR